MAGFLLRRLLMLPVVLWVIYTITFVLISLHPGNPFVSEKMPEEQKQFMRQRYGIVAHENATGWVKVKDAAATYANYLGWLARGDMGPSTQHKNRTVNQIVADTLPRSVQLGAFALAVAVLVGCTLGVISAVRSHGPVDYAVTLYALLGISLPLFVIGAIFLILFAFTLHWFPVGGWGRPGQLILPGVTLSLPFTAYIARLMRAGMLDVLNADHIRTARAKGLAPRQVYLKHAFKQAFLPVLSFLGPATASVLTGSFVVEEIFNVPGIGKTFVNAVSSKDYGVILGGVLVYSTLLILANLAVDLAYGWLDPRIRLAGEGGAA